MRIVLFIFLVLGLFVGACHVDLISINAAEIHVEDVYAQVIYDYGKDNNSVVYNEGARVQFKDSNFQFNADYSERLEEFANRYSGCSMQLDLNGERITKYDDNDVIELCLNQRSVNLIELEDDDILSDTIQFEYIADLESSRYFPEILVHHRGRNRSFRMSAKVTINGIYDLDFLEFQMNQIILIKLKPLIYNYLMNTHGVNYAFKRFIYYFLFPGI